MEKLRFIRQHLMDIQKLSKSWPLWHPYSPNKNGKTTSSVTKNSKLFRLAIIQYFKASRTTNKAIQEILNSTFYILSNSYIKISFVQNKFLLKFDIFYAYFYLLPISIINGSISVRFCFSSTHNRQNAMETLNAYWRPHN